MTDYVPARWFGAAWDAPICREQPPVAIPVGTFCHYCLKLIAARDSGLVWPVSRGEPVVSRGDQPIHFACLMKMSDILPGDEMERLFPDD